MHQFLVFVRKEFYHIFRDKRTLLILFGMPVVLIVLFGFAITNEIHKAQIAVLDQSRDAFSSRLVSRMTASGYFEVNRYLASRAEVEPAFRAGDIKLVVVIPENFGHDFHHAKKAPLQLITDSSDPNTATTLTNYANAIILRYQEEIRSLEGIALPDAKSKRAAVSDKEIKMALSLLEDMTEPWQPERYHDTYREDVMAMIEKKVAANQINVISESETEAEPARPTKSNVVDLMDLLKKSIEHKGRGKRPAQDVDEDEEEEEEENSSKPAAKTARTSAKLARKPPAKKSGTDKQTASKRSSKRSPRAAAG